MSKKTDSSFIISKTIFNTKIELCFKNMLQ